MPAFIGRSLSSLASCLLMNNVRPDLCNYEKQLIEMFPEHCNNRHIFDVDD